MKPLYPISSVLAYYSPEKVAEKGLNWTEPPHVHFANLILDWKSLLAFDRTYGVLLAEHWEMAPEIMSILLKAPNLNDEERQKWAAASLQKKWQISVTETDVQVALAMQSLLREAWKGERLAVELIQYGESRHAKQEALGPPRLTVAPSGKGITLHAKDLWSFIRVAFLLDSERRLMKVCTNPDCPTPYFLAKRKDQKYCERGDCTAFAQRQYALGWWERKGYERRAKKSKRSKRRK
jgi:hypothetical protein